MSGEDPRRPGMSTMKVQHFESPGAPMNHYYGKKRAKKKRGREAR